MPEKSQFMVCDAGDIDMILKGMSCVVSVRAAKRCCEEFRAAADVSGLIEPELKDRTGRVVRLLYAEEMLRGV